MTASHPDVAALLADRERLETWLGQLEERRGQVAPHVYAKVRADYEARLRAVVAQLAERAGELAAAVEALVARVSDHAADLTAQRDARAEDELRALVGEYTEAEWDARRRGHDEGIARVEADLAQAERDLAAAREVLAQATRPPGGALAAPTEGTPAGAADPIAQRPSVALAAAAAAAEPAPSPPARPVAEPAGPIAAVTDGDDGEARRRAPPGPVLDARPPVAPSPAPPPPIGAVEGGSAPSIPEAPSAPAGGGPAAVDELAFLKSVLGRATPLGVPRVSVPTAPTDLPPRAADPAAAPTPGPGPGPAGHPARASQPGLPLPDPPALRGSAPALPAFDEPMLLEEPRLSGEFVAEPGGRTTPQSAKTLKCSECGTLNHPTEWYCEKCGGELAAL